jgi:hypothetical protein
MCKVGSLTSDTCSSESKATIVPISWTDRICAG